MKTLMTAIATDTNVDPVLREILMALVQQKGERCPECKSLQVVDCETTMRCDNCGHEWRNDHR